MKTDTTKEMAEFIGAAVGLQEAIAGGKIISRGGRYVAIPFGVADKAMKDFFVRCEALKNLMEITA